MSQSKSSHPSKDPRVHFNNLLRLRCACFLDNMTLRYYVKKKKRRHLVVVSSIVVLGLGLGFWPLLLLTTNHQTFDEHAAT